MKKYVLAISTIVFGGYLLGLQGCESPSVECRQDRDCPGSLSCVGGRCSEGAPCRENRDCTAGYACAGGFCRPEESADSYGFVLQLPSGSPISAEDVTVITHDLEQELGPTANYTATPNERMLVIAAAINRHSGEIIYFSFVAPEAEPESVRLDALNTVVAILYQQLPAPMRDAASARELLEYLRDRPALVTLATAVNEAIAEAGYLDLSLIEEDLTEVLEEAIRDLTEGYSSSAFVTGGTPVVTLTDFNRREGNQWRINLVASNTLISYWSVAAFDNSGDDITRYFDLNTSGFVVSDAPVILPGSTPTLVSLDPVTLGMSYHRIADAFRSGDAMEMFAQETNLPSLYVPFNSEVIYIELRGGTVTAALLNAINLAGKALGIVSGTTLQGVSIVVRIAIEAIFAYLDEIGALIHDRDWEGLINLAFTIITQKLPQYITNNAAHHGRYGRLLGKVGAVFSVVDRYLRAIPDLFICSASLVAVAASDVAHMYEVHIECNDGDDGDSDGFFSIESCGEDCDDNRAEANPDANETCNSTDDNCDGEIDDGDPGGGGTCGTDEGDCVSGTEHCVNGEVTCVGATTLSECCVPYYESRCSDGDIYWFDACLQREEMRENCGSDEICIDAECRCVPDCSGVECGPDSCGGECPPGCSGGETCNASGRCICTPDCAGRECGDDRCGGTCAPGCMSWEYCDGDGRCDCIPVCSGRECGDDGCLGRCAPGCSGGETCNASGRCICTRDCAGRECGDDRCGGTCAPGCSSGETCNGITGRCETVCTPVCAGRECGGDGCGGSCPPGCSASDLCYEGGCCTEECDSVIWRCNGSLHQHCEDADGDGCKEWITLEDCGARLCTWRGCSWCTPDCDSRDCGSDSCGGSCGTCADDEFCDALSHTCICDPWSCSELGVECGTWFDGCGDRDCGYCSAGESCNASGRCAASFSCNYGIVSDPSECNAECNYISGDPPYVMCTRTCSSDGDCPRIGGNRWWCPHGVCTPCCDPGSVCPAGFSCIGRIDYVCDTCR